MTETPYSLLRVADDGPVRTIALHKPERKNPIGPAMVNELIHALDAARADESVRVIVLTGSGEAFSAGGDLAQMAGGPAQGEPTLPPQGDFADLLLRFAALGKPTVARVRGPAFGGGLGLVASCDFAVAAQSAKLGTPEIRRGLFPMQIMAVLARVVPRRKLLEMMLLGESLTAERALELGLVSHVVPDEALDAKVRELTDKLAAQSPTAMRLGLAAFHEHAERPLDAALPALRDALIQILGTDDAREGLTAFLEKRPPKWTGK